MRDTALQDFLDAARTAYGARARDANSVSLLDRAFGALDTPAPRSEGKGGRLPVCRHLDDIAGRADALAPDLGRVMDTFMALEPTLTWRPRQGDCTAASENFADNHANAMIVGPGGIEPRSDVWLGVSLVAPNVRYPDHRHKPEETYLVISPGDFRHGDEDWVHVDTGGTFYNPHDIIHAMRSHDTPLFAFWTLTE